MMPVKGKEYEYSARAKFPAEMEASIVLPAYSDGSNNPYLTGNEIRFGMDNGRISMNAPKISALRLPDMAMMVCMTLHSTP